MSAINRGGVLSRLQRRFPLSFFQLVICSIAFGAFAIPACATPTLKIIKASGQSECFHIRVANTPLERQKGLMYEKDLAQNAGMLFDFEHEKTVSMWMKNTFITLDILFFDKEAVLFQIHYKAEPFSEKAIRANKPARYVLEINGGISKKLGISIGDKFKLTNCRADSFVVLD